jgi:hypothetical protein
MSHEKFQTCIDACIACATECEHCVSACLDESDIQMFVRCIELDRECATACLSAVHLMTIGGENAASFCGPCADICEACAEECEKHDADHCRQCAEVCRNCAEECRKMATQHV